MKRGCGIAGYIVVLAAPAVTGRSGIFYFL